MSYYEKRDFTKLKDREIGPLTHGYKRHGGRNNYGHITAPRRGGGAKIRYRFIDFKRLLPLMEVGIVKQIEKDPFRSGHLALIIYANGVISYILAAERMDETIENKKRMPASVHQLKDLVQGSIIYNIAGQKNGNGIYTRPLVLLHCWSDAMPIRYILLLS
jgi:large subunit ribosomal protein L2